MDARCDAARLQAENAQLRRRVEHLTLAIEHLPQGLCLYDEDGQIGVFNRAYEETIGVRPGSIRLGMSTREIIVAMLAAGRHPGKSVEEVQRELDEQFLANGGASGNLVRDGRTFAVHCQLAEGKYWTSTFEEITQQISRNEQAEEALRESEERFRLAAEAAGFGVWDYDVALNERKWSGRLRQIFGFSPQERPLLNTLLAIVHVEDRDGLMAVLLQIRDGATLARFETAIRIRRASDRALRWVVINGWKTAKAGSPAGRVIMTMRDVTDEKMAEEKILWSASHDPLTGLANRAYFHTKLDHAIRSAGNKGAFGLLMLDIDRFKQINDTLGHDAGDRLLQMFARRLESVTRGSDTLARLGGDEFAIILDGTEGSRQDVTALANAVLDRMREPFVNDGHLLDCRASIGAALYPLHGRSATELMKHADLALYASKAAGRGTSTLFDTAMKADALRRESMVQQARGALREDRLFPHYQPKVDLRTGRVIGFEALLRWRTRHGKIRHPASLAAAFDDLDVANTISDRMIGKVIADMRNWLAQGVSFSHVAVNASAAEFRRDNFGERILERLHQAGIATHYFELEVTETVFLGRGAESVHRALELLNREGVRIALDDFGTGFASLRHLKQFPVDTIKIDRSFVRDMEGDAGDEAIVRAVINLGRSLAIKVVAEGIETPAQVARLAALDCELGQGYLFAKAVDPDRVPALAGRRFAVGPGIASQKTRALRLAS